jgi:hypothetical protein
MLIDANLSDWYWPFAVQAAVHIKNRVPHANLPPHKTPFEFWHDHKPNLSHLRLFGSACTSRILASSLSKFEPRGESAIFLGYAQNARGYILWVPEPSGHGGSIKIRRDVSFHGFPTPTHNNDLSPLWEDISTHQRTTRNFTMSELDRENRIITPLNPTLAASPNGTNARYFEHLYRDSSISDGIDSHPNRASLHSNDGQHHDPTPIHEIRAEPTHSECVLYLL